MGSYKSFSQLKSLARKQMQGKVFTLIIGLLIPWIITFALNKIAMLVLPGFDMISNLLFYIIVFIISLLAGVLQAGSVLLFLHAACDMPCKISDLFHCVKNSPDKAIKIQFVLVVIESICTLPANMVTWSTPSTANAESLYVSVLLFSLIGSIVYMLLTLGLFPVFYMMHDYPQYTAKDIYRKSWELMKGYKGRCFLLQLSFFPIILLFSFIAALALSVTLVFSFVSLSIVVMAAFFFSLFWIMVYINMTLTNFYLDLASISKNYTSQNSEPEADSEPQSEPEL